MPTFPTGAATTTSSTGPGRQAGLTLIELSIVMAVLGMMLLLSVPLVSRMTSGASDPLTQMSLWTEVLLERSSLRGEVLWVEVDPLEATMTVKQPVVVGRTAVGDELLPAVELVEVQDEYFPTVFELGDDFEIEDVQGGDGAKFTHDPFYVVVYPYAWIDPFTLHLRDAERRSWTGIVNSVTGRIAWTEGYTERLDQEFGR